MPNQIRLTNGTLLTIADRPFKEGGEGGLFRILSPTTYQQQVVKLYHADKRTPDRERKLTYLIANPPNALAINGHQSVIWPSQIAHQNNQFAGFTMPLATGETVEYLCHRKLPPKLGVEWQRFSFQSPDALKLRLNICLNIAIALQQVHSLGRYVLVDLKPDNMLVQSKTLVHVIDIDSIQIRQNGQLLFPASASTPDYTPPEGHHGLDLIKIGTTDVWDRFGMAVIFYRLLFGLHPFVGTCHPPFDTCNGLVDMIREGLFPHSPAMVRHFRVVSDWHHGFAKLPKIVQSLFIQCFDTGHKDPVQRPTAEDWCRVLAPKPKIELNRVLPSASAKLPDFTLSTGLTPQSTSWPVFPQVSYLNSEEPNVLFRAVYSLFGKPAKEIARDKLIAQQQKVKKLEEEIQASETTRQRIESNFGEGQSRILADEVNDKSALQNRFNDQLKTADNQAINLYKEEIGRFENAQQALETQLVAVKAIIDSFNTTKILPINSAYKIKQIPLQDQLNQLTELENNELRVVSQTVARQISTIEERFNELIREQETLIEQNLGIDNQQQFRQLFKKRHIIANQTQEIFGRNPTLAVACLKYMRVVSAADFTDTNVLTGEIKLTSGTWIKVAQVGPDRAGYLKIWLDKVEKACQLELNRIQKVATAQKVKIPDQLPTQKVDTERQKQIARRQGQRQQDSIIEKYTNQKRPINQHLLRLKNDYDTNTVTIRRELDKLMNDSATKQKEYKANYEKTRQQTAQFYDQKHRALKQEVVDHLMATKNELNRLKAQTHNRLQENLDHFSRQMIQQIQLAQSLLGDLTHEYAALTELEEQYQKLD